LTRFWSLAREGILVTDSSHLPYASQPVLDAQALLDQSHLRTLSICHYVLGGIEIAFSSLAIIHVVMGILILTGNLTFPAPPGSGTAPPSRLFGAFFVGMGGSVLLLGWTVGILTILSGRFIAQRRRRTFSLVVAGLNCLWVPFGTVLGVFAFIVLLRPSVRDGYLGMLEAHG
jgi:hypothetical protein